MITGNCAHPVACRTSKVESEVEIIHERGKTAPSPDYSYTTHVTQHEPNRCIQRCEDYCVKEGVPGIEEWPNCKAFSSNVEAGGTCHCYGWTTKPTWYYDENYVAGWCEK